LKRVLNGLHQLADRYKDEQLRNDVTFQSGRLKALEGQRIRNIISSDDDHLHTAKIRQALLQIINDLPNDWTAERIESNSASFPAGSKIKWKKYAAYLAAAIALLAGIAEFSRYSLSDFFEEKKTTEQPAITSPPSDKASTSGDNSPAVITDEGDVNINYGEPKPKKDSTINK